MTVLRKADFAKWRKRELWKLYEAISLLLGVEPDEYMAGKTPTPPPFDQIVPTHGKEGFVPEFLEIRRNAEDAIAINKLRPYDTNEYQAYIYEMRFYPSDFLEWAASKELEIPEELDILLQESPQDNSTTKPDSLEQQVESNELSEPEREYLLKTIGALASLVAQKNVSRYWIGDELNVSQIANDISSEISDESGKVPYGMGDTILRTRISKGIKLLKQD